MAKKRTRGFNRSSPIVVARSKRTETILLRLRHEVGPYSQIAEWLRARGFYTANARAVSRWCQGVTPYEREVAQLENAVALDAIQPSAPPERKEKS